jgi:hypothetical protein
MEPDLSELKGHVMKTKLAVLAAMFALASISSGVEAKGCLKGAVVGAVGGHVAGRHGVAGAAAGCAVGHHIANRRENAAQAPATSDATVAPSAQTAAKKHWYSKKAS